MINPSQPGERERDRGTMLKPFLKARSNYALQERKKTAEENKDRMVKENMSTVGNGKGK